MKNIYPLLECLFTKWKSNETPTNTLSLVRVEKHSLSVSLLPVVDFNNFLSIYFVNRTHIQAISLQIQCTCQQVLVQTQ